MTNYQIKWSDGYTSNHNFKHIERLEKLIAVNRNVNIKPLEIITSDSDLHEVNIFDGENHYTIKSNQRM